MTNPLAGVGLGLGQAIIGTGNAIIQGEYNKQLQEEANKFTREQSQNQIKYNIRQMKDEGLSPMMLFDHGNATGGGSGGGRTGASAPDYGAGVIAGLNTVGKILERNERLDLEERKIDMQNQVNINRRDFANDRMELERQRLDLEEKKINNQIRPPQNYENHKYSKEELNNLFDSLDDVEI